MVIAIIISNSIVESVSGISSDKVQEQNFCSSGIYFFTPDPWPKGFSSHEKYIYTNFNFYIEFQVQIEEMQTH